MTDNSFRYQTNTPSSFRAQPAQNTQLDKIFRLYSPNNYIPVPKCNSPLPKNQNEKAVIQLIFPHPNLLFIHPQNIKDPAEKQAFLQLNMMKNILQRKQPKLPKNISHMNLISPKAKPMTAPHLRRSKEKNLSLMSISKKENDDSVNVCTLICDKQSASQEFQSLGVSWRKSKAFTSKSQFRKAHLREKQNQELKNEKDFRNKVLSRNTFEFMLEEKKKELAEKYDDDKMARQELYKKSVKSPKTQMYINIERKFLKYFKKP